LRPHHVTGLIVWFTCLAMMMVLRRWSEAQPSESRRRVGRGVLAVSFVWLTAGLAVTSERVAIFFTNEFVQWTHGSAIMVAGFVISSFILLGFWRQVPFDPGRRRVLHAVRAATFAAPAVGLGFAVAKRNELRLNEVDIRVPGLPKDLDGLRIVQLSDIHLSPFLTEAELARAVDMANETKANLALVTGDLVTRSQDPLDVCLHQLSRLKSDAGVFGCMGNHELYAETEEYTTVEGARLGLVFLRQQNRVLQFGNARINLAGVDYQQRRKPYLIGAEELVEPGALNVLLSHNPDVFPVAAKMGFPLTLAGHTHGGQVTFEIVHKNVNVARFATPYVYGLYTEGSSSIFVTRGIGTVGVPARLGAPPEVALIRLCAT
jgi:predicted MPP superfamily phosphohydrolase